MHQLKERHLRALADLEHSLQHIMTKGKHAAVKGQAEMASSASTAGTNTPQQQMALSSPPKEEDIEAVKASSRFSVSPVPPQRNAPLPKVQAAADVQYAQDAKGPEGEQ